MTLLDLHTHILPGLDDGPETMDESLSLARDMVAMGFSKAVATPHWFEGKPSAEEIRECLEKLRKELLKEQIPLQVLPGAECTPGTQMINYLETGELLTLNESRFILIEPPAYQPLPPNFGELLYELRLRSFYPIIAHPERAAVFQQEPALLYRMVQQGALTQITLGSLTGLMGPEAKQAARSFFDTGLAHILATDAHGSGYRLQACPDGAALVDRKWGSGLAVKMMVERPAFILEDKLPPLPEPGEQISSLKRKKIRWPGWLNIGAPR